MWGGAETGREGKDEKGNEETADISWYNEPQNFINSLSTELTPYSDDAS